MKQRRFTFIHMLTAVLAGILATLLVLWLLLGSQSVSLLTAWGAVRTRFVGEYDPDTAMDSALRGMVAGLGDRWSYYLNAEESAYQREREDNRYVGIGVTAGKEDERGLFLLQVYSGGPAEEAGLKVGEVITAVDGVSAAGETGQESALEAIKGEEGTEVTLTVMDAAGRFREVQVTRRAIQGQLVRYELLDTDVGYVAVSNFYTDCAQQFRSAVDDLVEQGAVGLVFDMRNNGGGYVHELTDMLDYLLPEGPIFRSQDVMGLEEVIQSDENYVNLPMATLVNRDTYSAAEIFAAQLQESAGAAIVGEETSGKGYSQQPVYLPNGGELHLSTGKYTTGAGVSLVGTGVSLDARVELTEEESLALWTAQLGHEEDAQLQKALELLK